MCTSGSFKDGQDGNEEIKDNLRRITGCANVTTTGEAVIEGMKALGLKQTAMLTPYDEEITRREVDFLGFHGIGVPDFHYRDIEDNLDRGAIPPEDSLRHALDLDYASADGLFLSCANVPAIQVIDTLEERTGKPVVTSSQATVWKSLRLAGVEDSIPGYGVLLRDF
jgi:maleate isomerase